MTTTSHIHSCMSTVCIPHAPRTNGHQPWRREPPGKMGCCTGAQPWSWVVLTLWFKSCASTAGFPALTTVLSTNSLSPACYFCPPLIAEATNLSMLGPFFLPLLKSTPRPRGPHLSSAHRVSGSSDTWFHIILISMTIIRGKYHALPSR